VTFRRFDLSTRALAPEGRKASYAARVSWRTNWRSAARRVLPLLVLIGVGLVGVTLFSSPRATVDVVVEFGDRAAAVRSVQVEYVRDGDAEPAGHMLQRYGARGAAGSARHTIALPHGDYTAAIVLETDAGSRLVERRFHVDGDATVRLRAWP
jgi:hypothetical protein